MSHVAGQSCTEMKNCFAGAKKPGRRVARLAEALRDEDEEEVGDSPDDVPALQDLRAWAQHEAVEEKEPSLNRPVLRPLEVPCLS